MADIKAEETRGREELKRLQYLRLRLATIVRVDWHRMTVDVKYLNAPGGRTDVPITTSYWSPQAFMGAIPEVSAVCILGFYHQGADIWRPVILGYLPNSPLAARRIQSSQIGLPPEGEDDFRNEFSYIQRRRLRKSYPGQPLLTSSEGSDVHLSDDVLLSNSMGNEITLRADDQAIVSNSVSYILNTAGGYTKFGPVYRNAQVLDDHILRAGDEDYDLEAGTTLVDPTEFGDAVAARLVRPIVLPNGKKMNYIGNLPITVDQGTDPFTEHRTEVFEFTPLTMSITEDTDLTASVDGLSNAVPLVETVMGTIVGRNTGVPETYGRVLKPSLFRSLTDANGDFRMEEAQHAFGPLRENEIRSTAAAFYRRVGKYQHAISKVGNVTFDIPKSTGAHALGEGHSVDGNLQGSAKVAIGKEREKGNSLYLTTDGSVKGVVGAGTVDENGEKGRSVDLTALAGVALDVTGVDDDGYSVKNTMVGIKREEIGRDSQLEVKGNYDLLIHGQVNEEVLGQKVENYVGARNVSIGEGVKETISADRQVMIGTGRKVTIASPGTGMNADELLIVAGNQVATLTLGNRIETLTAGNDLQTLVAGNKVTTVTAGAYTVTVGTGAVSVATGTGAVSISTASGAMSLAASGIVQITGGTVNVLGGLVKLGPAALTGPTFGVVTSAHPCLVTGAPHVGSVTVKATP